MIAFIPARYDSSRFPGKVLIEIGGKPLINHVVENAAKCDYISEVVVLTDDPRIVEAVSKVDFTKVRIVDSTLGHSGSDRVHRYLMKNNINDPFIIIQADCPDLDPMLLNGILAGLVTDTSFPIHTLAYSFLSDDKYDDPDDPNTVKVVFAAGGKALYFSRSCIPYNGSKFYKHIGVYIFPQGIPKKFNGSIGYYTHTENLEQIQWMMDGMEIKVHTVLQRLKTIDVPRDYAQFSALTMK